MMTAATAQAANAARFAGAPLASLSDDSVVLFRGAFSALLPPCCAFACESADYDSCKSKVQKGTSLHWSVSKQNMAARDSSHIRRVSAEDAGMQTEGKPYDGEFCV